MPAPGIDLQARGRRGCLGCLAPLAGFCVVGVLFVALVRALFAPWSYFLGGTFHPMPAWVGVGRLHAASGDFLLYLELEPARTGRLGYPGLQGMAVLITPRRENVQLTLVGGFLERQIGLVPDGHRLHVTAHRRYRGYAINPQERRPRLELYGTWRGPDLVMTDAGSLSRAFTPDGRVYLGPERFQPATRETLGVTLVPCSWNDYLRVRFTWGGPWTRVVR